MELEGGIKATYMQCHYTPDSARNYTFIGTEGRVENVDSSRIVVKTRQKSRRWTNLADRVYDVKPPAVKTGHGGADPLICRDFVNTVLNNRKVSITPLAGRMSVAAGCAGTCSIRNNSRVVDIPPVPEEIKGYCVGKMAE